MNRKEEGIKCHFDIEKEKNYEGRKELVKVSIN